MTIQLEQGTAVWFIDHSSRVHRNGRVLALKHDADMQVVSATVVFENEEAFVFTRRKSGNFRKYGGNGSANRDTLLAGRCSCSECNVRQLERGEST